MHNELLLEIGSEEIPAGFIAPALENMQKAMAQNWPSRVCIMIRSIRRAPRGDLLSA